MILLNIFNMNKSRSATTAKCIIIYRPPCTTKVINEGPICPQNIAVNNVTIWHTA
jgi:hypothetical protein